MNPLQAQFVRHFGTALRAAGITQAEFCRRAGVTQKHLSRFLNGYEGASLPMLHRWALILGYRWVVELREVG